MADKRRRRDQRQEQPKSIRLTKRDIDIIEDVHLYRVLRQDQIKTLYFGTDAAAQRVLARLYDHRFLERKFLPVILGRSPTLYVLDKRGADLLRAERGYDNLVWYSSNKDLKTDFIEHTAAINDFRVSIVVSARRKGLKLITWASETQLKGDHDPIRVVGINRPYALIPDGYFALSTPYGNAHFFLEVDRGTETLERFKQKLRAYIAYHSSGAYEQRYGTKSLRVLTVATGVRRLENLLEAAKQVAEEMGGRRRFWFALASDLTQATVLSQPVWYVAEDKQPHMLIEAP